MCRWNFKVHIYSEWLYQICWFAPFPDLNIVCIHYFDPFSQIIELIKDSHIENYIRNNSNPPQYLNRKPPVEKNGFTKVTFHLRMCFSKKITTIHFSLNASWKYLYRNNSVIAFLNIWDILKTSSFTNKKYFMYVTIVSNIWRMFKKHI